MSVPTPARRAAYETVRRVFEDGAWADRSFRSSATKHGLVGRERAQGQALAYGAVQRRGTADHLIGRLTGRPVGRIDPPLLGALRLGLYELLFASGSADHAAVDQAVALARGGGGRRRGAGLVNAVLRRAARERASILAGLTDADPASASIAHSIPRWIAELWWEELGPEVARGMMKAANRPAERCFRVTGAGGSPEAIADLLSDGVEGSVAEPLLPGAPPSQLAVTGGWDRVGSAVEAGGLVPQSRGSALVVDTLGSIPGERVLDLCAGPGIKSTAIAERIGGSGELVAVERDAGRARELEVLLQRTGGGDSSRVVVADASAEPPPGPFDAVLVDPPCSGLGTLASRPDIRWRRTAAEIPHLRELQARILDRAAGAVRPGGRIVYSTCTISAAENQAIAGSSPRLVDDLSASAADLALAGDPRFLQTLPDRDRTDGFFVARIDA